MSKLFYVNNVSLDGYCEDENGNYEFGPLDPELLQTYNTLTAATPTFLYGRRLYEAMALWETDPSLAQLSPVTAEFAKIWRSASKIVYSTTLTEPWTQKTRIAREFDPAAVRQLKEEATGDITVGGATLASQAINAGLVDECQLFVWPSAVGRGKPALQTTSRTNLELLDQHRFDNGVLLLRYRPVNR